MLTRIVRKLNRTVQETRAQLVRSAQEKLKSEHQIGFNQSYLSRICQPKTVIDVGVGYGTFPLHNAFPDAKFILVEPLDDYSSYIDKIAERYDCITYYKAVSEEPGQLEINVDTGGLTKSSFSSRSSLTQTGNKIVKKIVDVTTLDTIYGENSTIEQPIFLKIDTEGHELSVLKGAKALLEVVDVVVAEVSIAKRFEDSYDFEDLIHFMHQHGFYVFSFLTMPFPVHETRQRFTDIVFKKRTIT